MPRWLQSIFVIGLIIWFGHRSAIEIMVDWLWFDANGYLELFQTRFVTQVGIWLGSFALIWGFLHINMRIASGTGSIDFQKLQEQFTDVAISQEQIRKLLRLLRLAV